MKHILLFCMAFLMMLALPNDVMAQKKSKKQIKAEEEARLAHEADSIAKLEASLIDGVQLTFKHTDHNFGEQIAGSDIVYDFEFMNTGKQDLLITNVTTSCGCTTPQWPKQPIKSKEKGIITVRYDSSRIGSFSKTITVKANAENSPVVLSIRGVVKPKN